MYCSPDDLRKYVFYKYLDKIEALEPGLLERQIAGVCAEIDDALRPRFRLPLVNPPETVRRIATVMTAYRCVGAITSIMDSEAASANVWIPLQTQYKEVMRQLAEIAEGRLDIGLAALGNAEGDTDGGVVATGGKAKFGDDFWRRF